VALQKPTDFNMLALALTGDLGPFTIYTTRQSKIVWFPKSPPLEPPSGAQLVMRNRWRRAASEWKTKSQFDRSEWERIVQKAGLRITGYNFFLSLFTHPDPAAKATIEFQTGEVFP